MAQTGRLGIFAIVMITITSVDSLRNLPATALFGSPLVVFFLIAGLFFLVPSALISSELASTWPKTGGVYVWVREAFGQRYGLLAVWFQWIENVVWYPTILSFIAATLAQLINPELADQKTYQAIVITLVFWSLTLLNLMGIKSSALFSEFCGMVGLLVPMTFIIALGVSWWWTGQPMQVSFHLHDMLPNLTQPGLLVSLTAVVLTFSGMEIATVHAQDVRDPKRDYPVALILSLLIIFFTMLFGSLSIAMIVPKQQLSLVAGIMQAFEHFFQAYHLSWMVPIIAVCIIIGSLGGTSNWIIAPSRGLQVALRDEQLAPWMQYQNKHGSPAGLLILQAVIVTAIAMVLLYMPSVNGWYWILTVIAAQLYLFMYIIMFAAAIYLRYKFPEKERPFRIPGSNFWMWLVAGIGIATSIFTLFIGFFPPDDINVGTLKSYEVTIFSALVLMSCPPFVMHWWKSVKAYRVARAQLYRQPS